MGFRREYVGGIVGRESTFINKAEVSIRVLVRIDFKFYVIPNVIKNWFMRAVSLRSMDDSFELLR
jgi:hypothetical protein